MPTGARGDDVLRAKYLDWCSARVAERFVELTPDQIYELAERATQGEPGSAGVSSSQDGVADAVARKVGAQEVASGLSFRVLVERVTEVLRKELDLPGFEAWAKAYRAAPERFDDELLGLWEDRAGDGS